MQFADAVAAFLLSQRARRRSPNTIQWYVQQFEAFDRFRCATGAPACLPDAPTIERFLLSQGKSGLSPSTLKGRYIALGALWRWAEKRRLVRPDENPMPFLDSPRVPKRHAPHVTPDQFQALYTGFPRATWLDRRDSLVLCLLFYSGLRLAELVALAPEDVDTVRREVVVREGKGMKARVCPCAPQTARDYVAYLYAVPEVPRARLLLKSDGYDGIAGALQTEGVRQMLLRRFRAAGLEPMSPHAFRHGYAMWALNAGMRLSSLSTSMGHSSISLTANIYARTLASTVQNEYDLALARMEGASLNK